MVTHIKPDDAENENENESFCKKCGSTYVFYMHKTFYNIGYTSAKWAKTTMCVGIFLFIIMTVCVVFLQEEETRPERLWVAEDTESREDFDYVQDVWRTQQRMSDFLLVKNKAGPSVITADVMQDFLRLHEQVLAINVSVSESEFPGMWDFERKCYKLGTWCFHTTVLDLWKVNNTVVDALTDTQTLNDVNTPSLYLRSDDGYMSQNTVIGGRNFAPNDNTTLVSAEALMNMYVLYEDEITEDGERFDPVMEAWEKEFGKVAENFNSEFLDIYYFTAYSWSDEFSKLLVGDLGTLFIAYVVIIIYASINLGKRNAVRSGVGLAFAAVISVVLATYTAFGLCSLFGVFWAPIHANLFFLLLALGVDDAFVIVYEYDHVMKSIAQAGKFDDVPVEEVMGRTIQEAGASIMLTSFTDFFVFMLGATTHLPALESYCIYAALGVMSDFLFQITFFTACLTINHYRAMANRRDIFCCFKVEQKDDAIDFRASFTDVTAVEDKDADRELPGVNQERCCYVCPHEQPSLLPIVFEKLAEVLNMKWPAIILICISLTLTGFGITGLVVRRAEFDVMWFVPEDSMPAEFVKQQEKYFGSPLPISYYVKEIDYFANQQNMKDLHNMIMTTKYVDQSWDVEDWHHSYLAWASEGGVDAQYISSDGLINDSAVYYSSLDAYVNTNGTKWENNILWTSDAHTALKSSKIDCSMEGKYVEEDGIKKFDAIKDMRKQTTDIISEAFPFSTPFVYWEEFGVIKQELIRNVLICMGVILVIVFSLVEEKQTALCVILVILLAVIQVAGLGYYWGLDYNSVVTIYTLIAIGLTVDYSIHIGYKYNTSTGTREERVLTSMKEMGPAVLHGSVSTFIAVLCLASAKSYIFSVFFKTFFLVGLLGGAHGLLILPSVLTLIGPQKLPETMQEKEVAVEMVV